MAGESLFRRFKKSAIDKGVSKKVVGRRGARTQPGHIFLDIITANEAIRKRDIKVVREKGKSVLRNRQGQLVKFKEPTQIVIPPVTSGIRRAPFVKPRRVLAPGTEPKAPAPREVPKNN